MNKRVETGYSSRTKKTLIEEAIKKCAKSDMFNRYKICEQVAEIMVNKYAGKNLDYHSKRMGMETNTKILKEVDMYLYRFPCELDI